MKVITADDISEAEDALQLLKEDYLRQHGWVTSSANPRCVWLWMNTINGVNYMLSLSQAVSMQEAMIHNEC